MEFDSRGAATSSCNSRGNEELKVGAIQRLKGQEPGVSNQVMWEGYPITGVSWAPESLLLTSASTRELYLRRLAVNQRG